MPKGLHEKYIVQRTDGKEEDCNYFVLNLTRDPHAIAAIEAYAKSCRESNPQLSLDLLAIASAASQGQMSTSERRTVFLVALLSGLLVGSPPTLALLFLNVLVNGYVLHLLGLWFVVPILKLPLLTVGQAMAVFMVVSFATYHYAPTPRETKEDGSAASFLFFFLRPLFVLGVAQVLRNFI
jgi:hypothetical protein